MLKIIYDLRFSFSSLSLSLGTILVAQFWTTAVWGQTTSKNTPLSSNPTSEAQEINSESPLETGVS
ncbi:MAG: hypothetical protein WBM44_17560, partial [Waterburya sp.]